MEDLINKAFNEYKKANISSRDLESVIAKSCPKSADSVRKLLFQYAECFEINSGVINSIKELKKSGRIEELVQMIGNINFMRVNEKNSYAEIGYLLNKKYWNKRRVIW